MSAQDRGKGPAMVFHAPYPVQGPEATGSAVRPGKMLTAFLQEGYRVFRMTGSGAERVAALRTLRGLLAAGEQFDFCYAENSTMPTVLTQSHHLPTHPLVDLHLFRLLRRAGVPTGLFYRDVYWRFAEYTERVNPVVAAGTRSLYHAELLAYARLLTRVYVPSEAIGGYVPHLDPAQLRALPPGGAVEDVPRVPGPFTVLYVGNVSSYYRMQEFLAAAARVPQLHVILCVPADSWEAVSSEYQPLGANVEVVHRSGAGLRELFARADVCSLMVEPSEYRDFAAPVKLFEYVGHGKPVLASAGTHAASLVAQERLGWAVPYTPEAMLEVLHRLSSDPEEVAAVTEQVGRARHRHTWRARARQVADDLTGAAPA